MEKFIKVLIMSLFFAGISLAQYNNGPDFENNYRNTFTPVETALGGMTSYMAPSGYGHNINPAILPISKTQFLFSYRYNKLWYGEKLRYRTFNLNYNVGKYGAFGVSYIEYRPSAVIFFTTMENPDGTNYFKQKRDYYTFSYAIQVFSDFTIGLSINHEVNNLTYGMNPEYQGLDLAFLFNREVDWFEDVNTRIIFSAVLDNFYRMGDYKYENVMYHTKSEFLQKCGSLNFSGQIQSKKKYLGKRIIAANLQAGYTDEMDESVFSLVTVGLEVNILEYLTLRYANSQGNEEGRNNSIIFLGSKNTFGFGFDLPIAELTELDLPINVSLDYGHSFNSYYDIYDNGFDYMIKTRDINSFSLSVSLNEL